ncbi:hypothetical protein CC1G_05405 [Coprinopsis cinerea okayama7|uniref:RTA1-domain-containing protein n=1 Tax=Coprinopsis cinerea (strain Okayama-7 / 130 / ATCC MYA-4618 / FGSC 9003) TaxID=240176 RepID=A8NQ00_COPC7|nr:hypothetical protein CC1G_05405 [Coprinopsis cinerea okayama7\|eukprot:XP_001835443.2 hypothetical protein CC1G_05405 [Coprinopsis cinerea okayama7\
MSEPYTREVDNAYGYIPTLYVCIIFVVLFAISTSAHIVQACMRRQWFIFPTIIFCGVLEVLGWATRLWSHYEPFIFLPFQIQIVATIVGPTPLLAANFVIFGRIIRCLGTSYSRLAPRWYMMIFFACDFLSLVIQAVGGAIAAQAETLEGANRGGNIMLGGIAFQLSVIVFYSILVLEYFTRFMKDRPVNTIKPSHKDYAPRGELTKELKFMLAALSFNTLCLFIRAIYRTIELVDGWNGRVITTEVYFNVLDGAMIVLAIYTFNFFHPGWLVEQPFPVKREGSSSSAEVEF